MFFSLSIKCKFADLMPKNAHFRLWPENTQRASLKFKGKELVCVSMCVRMNVCVFVGGWEQKQRFHQNSNGSLNEYNRYYYFCC